MFSLSIRRGNRFLRSLRCSFCNNTSETHDVDRLLSKQSSSFKMNYTKEIYQYMKDYEAEHLYRNIPLNHLESKALSRYILINPLVARKIGQALKLCMNDGFVLESDPGFGLLSKELIHYVSHLRLFEDDIQFRSHLREFQKRHPQNIELFDTSLQKIHRMQYEDNIDTGVRLSTLFDDIPTDRTISMIMVSPVKRFISQWVHHLLYKQYFSKFSRLEFYFILPPSIYTRLMASPQNAYAPRYQQLSVMAQLMFKIELVLNDIPRKAFLPWPRKTTKKNKRDVEKYENDFEYMYLVRMSVQSDHLKHVQDEAFYRVFLSFVSEAVRGKKRMVPFFEKLIPGSGPRIILQGYDIYSIFRDLSPVEMFSLFLDFSKWPEFKNTTFYSYWNGVLSHGHPSETSAPTSMETSQDGDHEEVVDEDDNDTFIPGSKVK